MRLYVDDEPLTFDEADVREYQRSLDLRTGVLERRVLWETPSGKRIRMRDERIVSFDEHRYVCRYPQQQGQSPQVRHGNAGSLAPHQRDIRHTRVAETAVGGSENDDR